MANKESVKSNLIFRDYVVNYINFNLNRNFVEEPIDIQFNLTKTVEYDTEDNNIAYVTVNALVFEDAEVNNYPFTLDVSIEGKFEVHATSEEQKWDFTNRNAVAILFPYVRSLISTYTANANVPPLILPPINVLKLVD